MGDNIPITQVISLLFVVGAAMTVPFNVLLRNLRFKAIGMCQLGGVLASSLAMLIMAKNGFGVWTLIGGTIVLRVVTAIGVFFASAWRPTMHFEWFEVKPFLSFGLSVAAGRSLHFVFQRADVFLIGRLLGTQSVGYYSFAMNLASLPSDKIVSIVNQISTPLFARFQNDSTQLRDLYLKTTKLLAIILAPMYLAGCVWGDDIILTVLGEPWAPIIFLFRALCLVQFVASLSAVNNAVHTALGHPRRVLFLYGLCIPLMSVAIYVAAQYGLDYVAFAWLGVYPIAIVVWTTATLRALAIAPVQYLQNSGKIVFALAAAIGATELVMHGLRYVVTPALRLDLVLSLELSIMAIGYGGYLFLYERDTLNSIWRLRTP